MSCLFFMLYELLLRRELSDFCGISGLRRYGSLMYADIFFIPPDITKVKTRTSRVTAAAEIRISGAIIIRSEFLIP